MNTASPVKPTILTTHNVVHSTKFVQTDHELFQMQAELPGTKAIHQRTDLISMSSDLTTETVSLPDATHHVMQTACQAKTSPLLLCLSRRACAIVNNRLIAIARGFTVDCAM